MPQCGEAARGDLGACCGCGDVDILDDRLFSSIPYMKGAFFYRALEKRIGVDGVMTALSAFYRANVGRASRMSDLLDAVEESSGYDPRPCADAWLRQEDLPENDTCG